ncbi:hypothetical protein ACRRTK_006581 [Alexandromys fortis]
MRPPPACPVPGRSPSCPAQLFRCALTPGDAAPIRGAAGPSTRDARPSPGLCSLARPRVRSPRRPLGSGT